MSKLPYEVQEWVDEVATLDQEEATKVVNKWVGKIKRSIVGGVSIGKYPQSLVLDIRYQGGEIHINSDGKITVFSQEVTDFVSFKKICEEKIGVQTKRNTYEY